MSYIESARQDTGECIFCHKPAAGQDRHELVLARGRTCFIMLNAFPYSSGHLMVAPYRHVDSFGALDRTEGEELILLLGRGERALRREYQAQGFNMGVNLGAPAGAGVVGHLHAHLVPRWIGDTNFMTTIAGTKVLPEALDRTYERLLGALALEGEATPGEIGAG
jgi:ATP adenylyltransferase